MCDSGKPVTFDSVQHKAYGKRETTSESNEKYKPSLLAPLIGNLGSEQVVIVFATTIMPFFIRCSAAVFSSSPIQSSGCCYLIAVCVCVSICFGYAHIVLQ